MVSAPNVYEPRGNAKKVFALKRLEADEIILDGPVRTGKSRAWLELANALAEKYPKSRQLFVRKTRVSLTQSILVTWERDVQPHCDVGRMSKPVRDEYRYPNGSVIVCGGMDNPDAILSTEYDLIYTFEAREFTPTDWETLITRLSNNRVPYQKLLGDTNPDKPTHFLKNRERDQGLAMLPTRHQDNPVLFDREKGDWTEFGLRYMARLEKLTGVRYYRYVKGLWVAAEGVIYDEFDRDRHVLEWRSKVFPFKSPAELPVNWRVVRAVDFGFTNPFVCQWWAIDPDGRIYLILEWVRSRMLVEDHARKILEAERRHGLTGRIEATVCDHDAEDRATLERHLKAVTLPAQKAISTGIQSVQSRLKDAGDGRPRLYILSGCLLERDPLMDEPEDDSPPLPQGFLEEVDGYIWDQSVKKGEKPVDKDNHSLDAARYASVYADRGPRKTRRPTGGSVDNWG